MTRFIVCGKWNDGILRVLDTDDFVAEETTVEQLKVIQSMGYPIVFDNRYDFLYKLFWVSNMELIEKFILEMRDITGIFIPYGVDEYQFGLIKNRTNQVSFFCFMSSDDIVLFSIRLINRSYKLFYKRFKLCDLVKNFVSWLNDPLSLKSYGFSVSYSSSSQSIECITFDYECNILEG